jgi:transposase
MFPRPQRCSVLGADRPSVVMGDTAGDTAYDADHFRAAIAAAGAIAFIPNNPSRASKLPFDAALYKERHLVECCIGKLKQFRRIATRYEKTARNYLAVVLVAAIVLWLR